jgi:hypothetical protein
MDTWYKLKMNKCLNILDLPDEILLIIFKKMNVVNVLYSLVDVNQRFDRLAFDPLIIHNIDLTEKNFQSVYDQTFSVDDKILSKICDQILCRISDQINALTVEQHSIQRILHATDYPQLYSLSLVNFDGKTLDQYLTGIVFKNVS